MSIANPYLNRLNLAEIKNIRIRKWACIASLSVAGILIVTKTVAYLITDSVSLMTSLMDSTFDAMASSITMISVIHAAYPADKHHRFGHGKLEALSALGQALFILGSAGYLFFESIHRFIHPQPVKEAVVGIGVMVLSIVLTGALIAFQLYVIRKTKSVAISGDHLHYKGDLLMNISVIVALILSHYSSWLYFDPLFAMVIVFFLLYSVWKLSKVSFGILLDEEMSDEERAKIEKLVLAHPSACAVHDLRTRNSGSQGFIEFHLELDGNLSLTKAHSITEEIELAIYKEFPKVGILIHQEPAGLDDYRLDSQIEKSEAKR